MRSPRSPNPLAVASIFGVLAAAAVYLIGPTLISGAWVPSGIVGWATISRLNPLEDYIWFGECLAVGVAIGTAVLLVYRRRGLLGAVPTVPRSLPASDGPRSAPVFALLIACAGVWVAHTSIFDVTRPIVNVFDPQPLTPGGMRFDPFHEGERLAFGSAFAQLADPFSRTFFIHGFGVDALPAILGQRLLPTVDPIVSMRLFVIVELIVTSLVSIWAAIEIVRARDPDAPAPAISIAVASFLALTRAVYPFMLLAIACLALLVRIGRLNAGDSAVPSQRAVVVGLLAPLGLVYSYSGFVTTVALVAGALAFLPALRRRNGLLGLAVGMVGGFMAVLIAIGPGGTMNLLEQVVYWIRYGASIWDRPPTVWFGPNDVLLPALGAAIAIEVALTLWIVSRLLTSSEHPWIRETAAAWVVLLFAVAGTRDAIDRGGYDYGERAFAASALGLAFLVGPAVGRRITDLGRPAPIAVLAGCLCLLGVQASTSMAELHPSPGVAVPADFVAAASVARPMLKPGDCTYTLTSEGLWYAVLGRPACTPIHQVTYGRPTDAQATIVKDLESRKPPVIVFTDSSAYGQTDILSVASTNSVVVRWVLANYRPDALAAEAWLWTPGTGPQFGGDRGGPETDVGSIQRGSEFEILIAGILGAFPGDAVYITIDAARDSVTAAPVLERCGEVGSHIWIPTFDLEPGAHVAHFWLVDDRSSAPHAVKDLSFTVEPRSSPIDLRRFFVVTVGEGAEALVRCAG